MNDPSEFGLDTTLRLAAIGTMRHGVPHVVLMFYETMYGVLQRLRPCETCLQQRELVEQAHTDLMWRRCANATWSFSKDYGLSTTARKISLMIARTRSSGRAHGFSSLS